MTEEQARRIPVRCFDHPGAGIESGYRGRCGSLTNPSPASFTYDPVIRSPALNTPLSPRPESLLHGAASAAAAAPSADEIARLAAPLRTLQEQVGKVVVGQDQMIRCLLIGLLTGGHVLLEGVPGLAKTLT